MSAISEVVSGSAIGGVDLIVGSSYGGTESPPVSTSVVESRYCLAPNPRTTQRKHHLAHSFIQCFNKASGLAIDG